MSVLVPAPVSAAHVCSVEIDVSAVSRAWGDPVYLNRKPLLAPKAAGTLPLEGSSLMGSSLVRMGLWYPANPPAPDGLGSRCIAISGRRMLSRERHEGDTGMVLRRYTLRFETIVDIPLGCSGERREDPKPKEQWSCASILVFCSRYSRVALESEGEESVQVSHTCWGPRFQALLGLQHPPGLIIRNIISARPLKVTDFLSI